MLILYLGGFLAVACFIAGCGLAYDGDRRAMNTTDVVTSILIALASAALLLGFIIMVVRPDGEVASWWSPGRGQQFLVAALGLLVTICAAVSSRHHQYIACAVLTATAACVFAFWGLLMEAGSSNTGPLAALTLFDGLMEASLEKVWLLCSQ